MPQNWTQRVGSLILICHGLQTWEPQPSPQAKQASLVVLGRNRQISCSHSYVSPFRDCLYHTNCMSFFWCIVGAGM